MQYQKINLPKIRLVPMAGSLRAPDRGSNPIKVYRNKLKLLLSIEWNSIRQNSPAHGIVTKTVHKNETG